MNVNDLIAQNRTTDLRLTLPLGSRSRRTASKLNQVRAGFERVDECFLVDDSTVFA